MRITKKRIKTTRETTVLLFFKKTANCFQADWCRQCAAKVFWIARAEINLLGILELPINGAIHTNGGRICSRSLIREIKKGEHK
ncbi:hypothetical protein BH10ACI1_BH10ACI1_03800 [soil metagenome]